MQDLSRAKQPLQAAFVAHRVTGQYRPELGVVIGDRDGRQARWDGLIDNVRLSRRSLAVEELAVFGGSKNRTRGNLGFQSGGKQWLRFPPAAEIRSTWMVQQEPRKVVCRCTR